MPKYLEQLIEDFQTFKELSNQETVNRLKVEYQTEIDKKIQEGTNLIETVLIPETTAIFDNIDDKIDDLLEAITALQNETAEEREKLIAQRRQFQKWMPLRSFFGVLKMTSGFLSFLGPEAALVGSVLKGATMIAEDLTLGASNPNSDLQALEHLLSATKDSISVVKKLHDERMKLWKEQLNDVNAKLDELKLAHPNYGEIINATQQANRLGQLIDDELSKEVILNDPAKLAELSRSRIALRDELKSQQKILEKQASSGSEVAAQRKKYLDQMVNIISLFDVPLDVYKENRNDNAKLQKMNDEIAQLEQLLEELERYRIVVYEVIYPTFKNLESDIQETIKNLKGASRFGLHVSRWRVQASIKDVRNQMQQMIKAFPDIENEIIQYVDKLYDTMNTIIDMYDRIEAYRESAEFAAYIADINSKVASDIKITDPALSKAVTELDVLIKSNQILVKYDAGMDTFKQYVFPFVRSYLEELELPSSLQYIQNNSSNFVEDLVYASSARVKTLLKKIQESSIIIKEYDRYVHSGVWFGSEDRILPPFSIWKYDEYEDEVYKLLSGKTITVTANIKNGIKKYATKFQIIQMHFKPTNQSTEQDLSEELKNYEVEMTHAGNSYYRCGYNNFYTAQNGYQTLQYSVKLNSKGEPASVNGVYSKIKDNDFILSPYATWIIRLIPLNFTRGSEFDRLAKFRNQTIDLELRGKGQYVDTDINVCDDTLSKYYTPTQF